jgi:hypothetical protein
LNKGYSWANPGAAFSRFDGPADPEDRDRRVAILCWLSLVFVAGLSFLYLLQAKDVSSIGYEIRRLEAERTRLLQQNAQLTVEIAELQALSRVEQRAAQLGFGPPERIGYIRLSGSQGR